MGGASWQAAFHDTQLFDIYGCFVVAIGRMKMRRCVFVPKHLNDDAIELANGGHGVVSIKNSHRLVLGFATLYRTYATGCGFAQNVSDGVTNPVAPFSHTPARFGQKNEAKRPRGSAGTAG